MAAQDATLPPQASLDRLPNHVNTVLIQIGRIFQHSVRSDNKAWGRAKNQAHETIPKSNRQFHETLDEAEIELIEKIIGDNKPALFYSHSYRLGPTTPKDCRAKLMAEQMNAKSVLERDLAVIRAKRAERENALRAERLRASGKDTSDGAAVGENRDSTGDVSVKLEAGNDTIPSTANGSGHGELNISGNSAGIDAVKSELFGENDNSLGQEIMTGELGQATATNGQTPQELRDLAGDIFNDDLGSAEFGNISTDADLDSMFNDTGGTGADSLNFDLDFTGSTATGDGLLAGNSSGHATSSGDAGNLDVASSEDINSLLPGLESYVNADGDGSIDDFAMIDVPAEDTNNVVTTTSTQQQASATSQGAPVTSTAGGASTTSADHGFDMFFGTDDLDMGGTEEINNLDFEWFN